MKRVFRRVRSRTHPALVFAACFVLAVVVSLSKNESAAAVTQCAQTGGALNYLTGAWSPNEQLYGVRATIELQTPQLCLDQSGTLQESSNAWVMLASQSGADPHGWAQVGYGYFRNDPGTTNGMHYFSQWVQNCYASGSCPVTTKFGGAPDTDRDYWVARDWGNGYLSMLINGVTILDETNFDPYSGAWASPIHPEIFAETHDCGSNIIGTQSNAASFSSIQGETAQNVWGNIGGLTLTNAYSACGSIRYAEKWGAAPTLFYTWTYPL